MGYWTEVGEFFGQFRRQYHTTGSVLPSSRALAQALIRPLRQCMGPRRILEVGPGTGAVTAEILHSLRPGDQLDIVEINDRFVAVLERRFEQESAWRRRRSQARIIHGPLQNVPGAGIYDFMISGVPLNNFSLALVREIFESYERLLHPRGTLSYFEYVWIRTLKIPFVSRSERERLQSLGRFLDQKIRAAQVAEEVVLWNVPPAVARHFCFGR